MGYPKYVITSDGFIGAFARADRIGALYHFPGGTRYADDYEIAHGSDNRQALIAQFHNAVQSKSKAEL